MGAECSNGWGGSNFRTSSTKVGVRKRMLNCISWNIRSMNVAGEALGSLIRNENPDIIGLQEVRNKKELKKKGYITIMNEKSNLVAILIKEEVGKVEVMKNWNSKRMVWAKIEKNDSTTFVCSLYGEHNDSEAKFQFEKLKRILPQCSEKEVIILTDANAPGGSKKERMLMEIVDF